MLAILVVTTSSPVMAKAPTQTIPVNKELSVQEMIDKASAQFGQDPKLIKKVAMCESGLKIRSHDGGRAKNMTGIHNTTFNGWLITYKKETGETLNIHSVYDQFKMMSWAFSKGPSYRNQWTTYVAYTKGGTYAFYSKLLQKHFVVRCA